MPPTVHGTYEYWDYKAGAKKSKRGALKEKQSFGGRFQVSRIDSTGGMVRISDKSVRPSKTYRIQARRHRV